MTYSHALHRRRVGEPIKHVQYGPQYAISAVNGTLSNKQHETLIKLRSLLTVHVLACLIPDLAACLAGPAPHQLPVRTAAVPPSCQFDRSVTGRSIRGSGTRENLAHGSFEAG